MSAFPTNQTLPPTTSGLDTVGLAIGLTVVSLTPGLVVVITITIIIALVFIKKNRQTATTQTAPSYASLSDRRDSGMQNMSVAIAVEQQDREGLVSSKVSASMGATQAIPVPRGERPHDQIVQSHDLSFRPHNLSFKSHDQGVAVRRSHDRLGDTSSSDELVCSRDDWNIKTPEHAESAKSTNDEYYVCELWNVPNRESENITGANGCKSETSDDEYYVNEGLGPVQQYSDSQQKALNENNKCSEPSIQVSTATGGKHTTTEGAKEPELNTEDDYYVNEGLGPKCSLPKATVSSQGSSAGTDLGMKIESADSVDLPVDDGYFVMESIASTALRQVETGGQQLRSSCGDKRQDVLPANTVSSPGQFPPGKGLRRPLAGQREEATLKTDTQEEEYHVHVGAFGRKTTRAFFQTSTQTDRNRARRQRPRAQSVENFSTASHPVSFRQPSSSLCSYRGHHFKNFSQAHHSSVMGIGAEHFSSRSSRPLNTHERRGLSTQWTSRGGQPINESEDLETHEYATIPVKEHNDTQYLYSVSEWTLGRRVDPQRGTLV